MSDVKQALNQDAVQPKNRIEEARNVEFLADFKVIKGIPTFKKGDKTVMHVSGAKKLEEKYPKLVKVTELNEKEELKKAKEVAGIKD